LRSKAERKSDVGRNQHLQPKGTRPSDGAVHPCDARQGQRIPVYRGHAVGDAAGNVIGDGDFDVQTAQVFRNIEAALKSAGASWANVVQFTTYLVHSQDIPKFMAFRLREFPKMFPDGKYPPNTLLMVDRLVKEAFLVEVQTIAAV
jgi:enamine deaminase RidA (YjgF/YER057c/UK114 family)